MKTDVKRLIAIRAAQELTDNAVVNLGIGIPTLIADYLDETTMTLHTENGMLGVKKLDEEHIDLEIVNAGKIPVGEAVDSSYFSSADSFAMIRGGHIDIAVLGALQVDERGIMANWAVPGKDILGVGGAMDLLEGAKKVIATTIHTSRNGETKFVKECTYPITSRRVIDMLITNLGVFQWKENAFELIELVGDTTIEDVIKYTEAHFTISPKLIKEDA